MRYKLILVDEKGETFAEAVSDELTFLEAVEVTGGLSDRVFTAKYYEWRVDAWVKFRG